MSILNIDATLFILQGVGVTLLYSTLSFFCGSLLGLILALLRFNQYGSFLINAYISFMRGTPLLVQLAFIYFVLPTLLGCPISIFIAGLLAFSLNASAYIAEIIQTGLNAIDKGQFEAAKALHIPSFYMWKDIILPQVLKIILPALINEATTLLKESALISTLGEQDIMRRAQLIASEHYTYIEPLCIAALTYYLLTLFLEKLSTALKVRMP